MRLRFPRTARLAVLLTVVAAVAVPMAVAGASAALVDGPTELTSSGTWFVELNGKPTADGGNATTNKAQKAAFRAEAKKAGVSFTERYAFDTLWNGVSIKTTADAATLKDVKGVKAVYPVLTVSIPETGTISPDLATALAMTGADVAQSDLGFDGTGVKVAVMDTGIDVDHPDLGGDGVTGGAENGDTFPNSRIVTGWDFVGNAYNANPASPTYNPTPAPDGNPDDCNGHGTHVSGIVGANGVVDGVAPGVTFGGYRVFGCEGSTDTDIMIAAMERAFADDMDILNMSIGSSFTTWAQYPTAAASDLMVKKGMVVVASIGNSGADGVYSAGAPGVGNDVIGVASFDNTHTNAFTFNTDVSTGVAYLTLANVPDPPLSGTVNQPIVHVGLGCNASPYLANPAGAIALIERGVCSFDEKYDKALAAGAIGVVIYAAATAPGLFAGGGVTTTNPAVFAVSISRADGLFLVANPASSLTWTNTIASVVNASGGTISGFSSFGLGAELAVKPDVGAPGGLIRSTYPLEHGNGYAIISGTSMASPHVAGAAALFLEAHPGTSPADLRDALQNSADPKNRLAQTYLDNVHRQGAGMLDIDDSILAETLLSPGKISLGEGNGGTAKIQLRNSSGSPVTYDITHQPAAGTTNTFAPVAYSTDYATASFSSSSVTVPGNGAANVEVTITPNPAMPDKGVYGGYVTFTPQGDGQTYRVPYAGFKGDYQSIQVLNLGAFLVRLTACSSAALLRGSDCYGTGTYAVPPAADPFTFATGLNESPFIFTHFDHQVRSFTADVYRASDNKWMGTGISEDYLPRNATATGGIVFRWDGNAKKGQGNSLGNAGPVADGTYNLKVTVIKALGTKEQAETWTSPNFIIDRP